MQIADNTVVSLHYELLDSKGELIEKTEAPVEYLPKRPGDVRDAQIDPALAKKELDWKPTTTLFEGMKQTVAYFQQRMPA